MKATQRGILSAAAIFIILFTIGIALRAQTEDQTITDNSLQPIPIGDIPDGSAFFRLSDYLANDGTLGPPWPFLMDTNASVYLMSGNAFLVDDSVLTNDTDLADALSLLVQPQDEFSTRIMSANSIDPNDTNSSGGASWTNFAQFTPFVAPSNALWLEIPTNNASDTNVIVTLHNTIESRPYTLLTATNLTNSLSTWTPELWLLGATGNLTTTQLVRNARPLLFISARTGTASGLDILSGPLDQDVLEDDTVTFSVTAIGSGTITYQWTCSGTNISGATASSYTVPSVQTNDAAGYAVIVSNGVDSLTSRTAQLTVEKGTGDPFFMVVTGSRQDYKFKDGVTYYIGDVVQLYGNTVLKGGSVIKFDWSSTNGASLMVKGSLTCDTKPYYPAILTSVDDDGPGEGLGFSATDGPPQPYSGTLPYLDLAGSTSNRISNLRISYAHVGVTTPELSKQLDTWDCQFFDCHAAIQNAATNSGGSNSLHNVLFAGCGTAILASSNNIYITGEQVTADVTNLWSGPVSPFKIALTNTLLTGTIGTAAIISTQSVAASVSPSAFQSVGAGSYYLPAGSSFHQSGTTNVSPSLLGEMQHKTTGAPFAVPAFFTLSGDMTFGPQASRYTNGAPDIGYYYDVLDYTVATITNYGNITVLPGTVIGFRLEFSTNYGWSYFGFDLRENSTFVSHGFPANPVTFVDVQLVQEQFQYPSIALFVPSFFPMTDNSVPPKMDFRFCNSYVNPLQYHVWSGYDETFSYEPSPDSLVDWTMQDCSLHGGSVNLGPPDDGNFFGAPLDFIYGAGSVSWANNLFDNTSVDLDPTYYWFDGTMNCDMSLNVFNNLFRNCRWFIVRPIPASAGNWALKDNLFDKVEFFQDTSATMDYDYNGYWKLLSAELVYVGSTNQLLPQGAHELVIGTAPQYQAGPFGNFYLPTNSALYNAGSRSPSDAGLFHYTTRLDQKKEGSEPSGHLVNIGLHYLAVTNSAALDSDGDGIPDYVEDANGNGTVDGNETSPALAQTVTGIGDATNSVYDDIDLSGSGLTGLMKKTLGVAPFDTSNPLKLTQVTMGDEPDFATFEIPLSYSVLTNSGTVNLNMNGIDVMLEDCTPATNGHCLLSFNVPFDPPGLHFMSAQFHLNTDSGSDNPIVTASGNLLPFWSSNNVQFFEMGSMFDNSGAYLDAEVFYPNTDYTIELSDPSTTPPTPLNTISNSTSSGFIQEDWNLLLSDGLTTYTGATVQAAFSVKASGTSGTPHKFKKVVARAQGSLSEWGPNMDVVYFRTPTNDAFEVEFKKNGKVWNSMQGVVNALIDPVWTYSVYNSYFNRYLPDPNGEYPGYITKRSPATNDPSSLITVQNLLGDITNGVTKQIYIHGHGTNGWMGNYNGSAYITANDVGSRLGNTFAKKGGLTAHHPYRFVFLDGCDTASGKDWRRSFGIFPLDSPNQAARNKTGPQAYVGWGTITTGLFNFKDHTTGATDQEQGYANTLAKFYSAWMSGNRLRDCLNSAATVSANCYPLPVDKNKNFTFTINNNSYTITNRVTSKLYLIGFPGLQVDRTDHTLDTDKKYAAPTNVE